MAVGKRHLRAIRTLVAPLFSAVMSVLCLVAAAQQLKLAAGGRTLCNLVVHCGLDCPLCWFGTTSMLVPSIWPSSLADSPVAPYSDPLVSSPPSIIGYSLLHFSGHLETSRQFWCHVRAKGVSEGLNWASSPCVPHTIMLYNQHSSAAAILWQVALSPKWERRQKHLSVYVNPVLGSHPSFGGRGTHGVGRRLWCSGTFAASCVLSCVLSTLGPGWNPPGGPGLALTVLNEVRATWSGFLFFLFFLSAQSLAFITVVLMWICKRRIYDSKMINGLFLLGTVSFLAKLGCQSCRGA